MASRRFNSVLSRVDISGAISSLSPSLSFLAIASRPIFHPRRNSELSVVFHFCLSSQGSTLFATSLSKRLGFVHRHGASQASIRRDLSSLPPPSFLHQGASQAFVRLSCPKVGTGTGDVALWDIKYEEKLVSRNFDVWNVRPCSMSFEVLF
ncbi:topless-related protein 1-like [Tripterygium wilfordii]|uniref:Topless-related protein 1-like n=1 Tax=Tripterygium wilfordii TaxID=458696 RepID=A0A7J7DF42_TRIWF|nr:topless-related protein 1-like [Tripterygium wilfordii]